MRSVFPGGEDGTLVRLQGEAFAVGIARYAAGRHMPPHEHDHGQISLVLSGSLTEEVDGVREEVGVGCVVAKGTGTWHEDRFGPDGATLLSVRLSGTDTQPVPELPAWRWFRGGAPLSAALRLAGELRRSPRDDDGGAEEALWTLAGCVSGHAEHRLSGPTPRWLKGVYDRLASEERARPSISALAREAGVHPVYLTRRFRAAYGCSPVEFVKRTRVLRAANLLSAGDAPLSYIAHASGFSDQSHLCRVLRAECGVPPGALRRLINEARAAVS
ncbi:MAG TPA: AraC family transcriptional regulator [Longimicrobium sp.]|jgi:AraC family transcriptional regulator